MNRSIRRKLTLAGVAGLAVVSQQAQAAPISINTASFSYTQDFDSLISNPTSVAVTAAWTNSATINGWVAFQSLPSSSSGASHTSGNGRDPLPVTGLYNPVTQYRAESGASNTGALYSHGAIASIDRALGDVGSGTPGDFFWGIEFTNNTGATIDSITVSYRGEQWRNGGNTSTHTAEFDYSRTATSYSDNAAFTAVAALNFTGPTASATAAALDGNDAANSASIGPVVINGVGLLAGETLRLRWFDDDNVGNDHGLAIDNFSFQSVVVPEPTMIGLAGALGFGLLRRRKRE